METFNIAIMDDNKSKINNLEVLFMQQSDKTTQIYDEKYSNYELQLCPINVEKSSNEVIEEITKYRFDAIIIDYDFTSFAKTSNNGIMIAKDIQKKFSEYPLFILTAYEDRLFKNEIFDAYQVYSYDNYINNASVAREFHSHIIEQILKSRKQLEIWETELKSLLKIPKNDLNSEILSKIIELDSKIENSIDGISSIPLQTKKDLCSGNLVELLKKADSLLEEF